MKINKREGMRRIAVVIGVSWLLFWSLAFADGLYDYNNLAYSTYPPLYLDSAISDAKARMWAAVIFGAIMPASFYFVGRYIWRGFIAGNDQTDGTSGEP